MREETYQDMFIFKRWHGRNAQEGTLSRCLRPLKIWRCVRAGNEMVVLIKLSEPNALLLSALRRSCQDCSATKLPTCLKAFPNSQSVGGKATDPLSSRIVSRALIHAVSLELHYPPMALYEYSKREPQCAGAVLELDLPYTIAPRLCSIPRAIKGRVRSIAAVDTRDGHLPDPERARKS